MGKSSLLNAWSQVDFLSVHVQDVLRVVLPDIRGQAYIGLQTSACRALHVISLSTSMLKGCVTLCACAQFLRARL